MGRKLVIQLPCYNEEQALPLALTELPRAVPGFDVVEIVVVDDGSTDRTSEVAQRFGAQEVVRLTKNQGLAKAFAVALDVSLRRGADVIVNTDADNQYCARDIGRLVQPVVRGEADIVVGQRPIWDILEFSSSKKWLQWAGSWAVRLVSRTRVADATSGFRAFSRDAALRLHVFSAYTYTLETIIQAGHCGMAIASVPVRTNRSIRRSRLIKSIFQYLRQSAMTIVRSLITYRPLLSFAAPGSALFLAGFVLGCRFLVYYAAGQGNGHIQSLILAALLLGTGFFLVIVGLVVDLIAVNRKLLESIDYRVRSLETAPIPVAPEPVSTARQAAPVCLPGAGAHEWE